MVATRVGGLKLMSRVACLFATVDMVTSWQPPPPPAPATQTDRDTLWSIKQANPALLVGPTSGSNLANWSLTTDPCLSPWEGVSCNAAGRVTYLSMCCGLTTIPSAIGELSALEYLILDNNALDVLPERMGDLTSLTLLDLGGNRLGEMPERLAEMTALKFLFLDGDWSLPQGPDAPNCPGPDCAITNGECTTPPAPHCCLGWQCGLDGSALSLASSVRQLTGSVFTAAVNASEEVVENCTAAAGGDEVIEAACAQVVLGTVNSFETCEQTQGCVYTHVAEAVNATDANCSGGGDPTSRVQCERRPVEPRTRCVRVREQCYAD